MAETKRHFLFLIFVISLSHGWRRCGAQLHHVVGDDRGWDPSSDLQAWSSGKSFRVGDYIWFTYSAAQESITELRGREEFDSCDLSNPIRMYTDGLNKVKLDGEGTRYFTSGRPENCKAGLKLHVDVQPQSGVQIETTSAALEEPSGVRAVAAGPIPSDSIHLRGVSTLLAFGVALVCFMGF
eukprot:TRINITY_DN19452_c0_g1_i1.p1 TRINITY_DN19452_c0_g1~~TRINITY_DN19452_c0_g1_i1.p1  ORF type:complete len:182 (-),score=21.32 TRINITY_DN19452_c0_g1_i1:266-811(-)